MLDGLKRLFSRPAEGVAAWDPVVVWAEQHQIAFRRVRDEGGFILEGHIGKLPWRLEWGPSQRPYVQGSELRLRIDAELPFAEIAAALGTTENSAKVSFHHAVRRLQALAGEEESP
jgi:hypothetical protein